MIFRSVLLPTLVIPIVGATLTAGVLTFAFREELVRRGRGAAATALAFLSGFVGMTGWPRWPPVEAMQRLFFLVALAALLAWFVDPDRKPAVTVWLARVALTSALLGLLLQTPLQNRWSAAESALWLTGLFVVACGLHWGWGRSLIAEGDRSDWVAAFVRIALLSGLAAMLGMSASARLAQLAGALTCGVGVVEVGLRVLKRKPWTGGASLVLATAVLGLLITGHFYAELGIWPAALTALACLMLGIPLGGRPWSRLLALVPLALAVGLSLQALLNQPEDPYADYYGRLGHVESGHRPG